MKNYTPLQTLTIDEYKTLFESLDEGCCIIKVLFDQKKKPVDFRYLEVNASFEKHAGVQDVVGKKASEVMGNLEDSWPQTYAEIAQTGIPSKFERYSEDLQRWFEVYAFRLGPSKDQKVAVFLKNITKRKIAAKKHEKLLGELRSQKERINNIFNHAPSFMCILRGPDHVFERVNKLYRQLVGNRDIIGEPVREALPETVKQGFIELLDRVYESGEPYEGKDIEITLYNQGINKQATEKRYLDFIYQPLRGSEGTITGIFVQGIDLTERHYAKEKLQAINNSLEERVKERTKAMRSYQKKLQSLASQLNKAEEQERQRLASELHDKLGQMLSVAKMQVDGLQYNITIQDSSSVKELKKTVDEALSYTQNLMSELEPPPALDKEDVTEVLLWTAKQIEKQGLEVIIENDERPKPVEKQMRTVIHQSVRELLLNVIKHAEVKKAHLILKRDHNEVLITVEDQGEGFKLNEQSLYTDTENKFGLFNIKERVEWHGGHFNIQSDEKHGTKATLSFPVMDRKKDKPQRESTNTIHRFTRLPGQSSSDSEHAIRIMLVDDHDMVRNGLRQMIEEKDGMMVIAEASNGKEAIELAQQTHPDVIIMDVNMPVMDGIEATQKIKNELPGIEVIGLSLHDSQEVLHNMEKAGSSAYLTKNEAFETLCDTIKAHVSHE